jgi:biopolymer transport protein TolR
MSFSSGGGGSRKAMAEINITPLVDVMLVLLIIFMVAAPMIQTGVKVDLPQVKTPPVESKDEKLVLSITKEKRIYLADTEVPIAELAEKLQTNAKLQKDKELYVHADRNLTYGIVIEVMGLARAAGVESVGMITDPAEVRR